MSTGAVVGTLVGVALVAGLAYVAGGTKTNAATPAAAQLPTVQPGHRYTATLSCSIPFPNPASALSTAFPNTTIVSSTPGGTTNASTGGATQWTVVFDYRGTTAIAPPAFSSISTPLGACSITAKDLGPTPASASSWVRATTINPGDDVRLAIAPADLATLAASYGVPVDVTGLQDILSSPVVSAALQFGGAVGAHVQLWAPGDPTLPADWPTDDPSVATEYHGAFNFGGTSPLQVSMSPVPMIAWVRKVASVPVGGKGVVVGGVYTGGGTPQAPPGPVLPPGGVNWQDASPGSGINATTWVRLSATPAQVGAELLAANAQSTGTPAQIAASFAVLMKGSPYVEVDSVQVWAPGDANLPADWPTDDPGASSNYHVQYKTTAPFTMGTGQQAAWKGLLNLTIIKQGGAPQNVQVSAGQTSYPVSAIAGSVVNITTPGPIVGVTGSAAVSQQQLGSGAASNTVAITLSGTPGAFYVQWSPGAGAYPQTDTFNAS